MILSRADADPSRRGLFVYAFTLGAFFAASAAPTPLYRVYQQLWSISPTGITVVFAVYAFSLLAALLTIGSISDHIGRRPAVALALVLQAIAMVLFILADGYGWLVGARLLQGFATGAAASAIGAALVDADSGQGPIVNSLAPLVGMAVGALLCGALVEYAPAPAHLVYILLLALVVAQLAMVARTPETATRRGGLLASLWPRVAVPGAARRMLLLITPINVALWTLGGFFLSLMPSLIVSATGSRSTVLAGAVVAALMLSGAATIQLIRGLPARRVVLTAAPIMIAGMLVLVLGVHQGSVPVLLVGTLGTGIGFGAGFLGCVGSIVPLAAPDERAELLAAFYVESYLAFSVPAIIAGVLAGQVGLRLTTDIYAAAIILLVVVGCAALMMDGRTRTARA
ncbi:MFS transporter [Mangrovibrevibacter kandeliae]|uniref:MFS transporter n=1 Tax=Mangrovibrevibacter kandeliae TaxID=2968473 RepID=UPI002118060B|nr:MFS transporter [Aurantimonas sp. CSK15Z-1]MCQ8784232.1 MFS transporter [Aurantimonas sp. CSK15Z-1]